VKPGAPYGDEIISGIETSSAFILILSGASSESDFVAREVERAITTKKPVIPVRIENVELSRAPTVYFGHAMGRCVFRKVREPIWTRASRRRIARICAAIAILLAWPSNTAQTTDQAPTTGPWVISNPPPAAAAQPAAPAEALPAPSMDGSRYGE
jgi:hypothetical protein